MLLPDVIKHFEGCVYVVSRHCVLTPTGEILAPEQFNSAFGGYDFVFRSENRTTRKAFEALTQSQVHRFPKARTTCFKPWLPFGVIVDGEVNTYRPAGVPAVAGDVSPFLRHVELIIPDAGDRHTALQWMAAVVQRPGVPIRWALVLQGVEGNGKTTLLQVLRACLGNAHVSVPSNRMLESDYNGYAFEKLLVGVEEIYTRDRFAMTERLKPMITNSFIDIRIMRNDMFMVENTINLMAFTNHKGAVQKSKTDRRWCVIHTAQQTTADLARCGMDETYFQRLYNWIGNGGAGFVHDFLLRYDTGTLPHVAPVTTSTDDAIAESMSNAARLILDAIEAEERGFRGGYISSVAARKILGDKIAHRAISKTLEELGYTKLGVHGRHIFEEGGARPHIYAKNPEIMTLEGYYPANFQTA